MATDSENKNSSGDTSMDKLTDHEYDGIKEFDNALPNWWLMTFLGTIIFAAIYYLHYEFGGGPTLKTELVQEMEKIKSEAAKEQAASQVGKPGGGGALDEEGLKAIFNKPEAVAIGKEVYKARCSVCHGDFGQGLVGPNLTDTFWINGDGSRMAIVTVITKGVPEKGMLAWEQMLQPDEIHHVAAYVYSLKGSNPANPKAPQGNDYKK